MVLHPRPRKASEGRVPERRTWPKDFEAEVHEKFDSVFCMDDPWRLSYRNALEQAVELGKKARIESWSAEYLDVEFGCWLEDTPSNGDAKRAIGAGKARQIKKRQRARN